MTLPGVEHHSGPEPRDRPWATRIIKNKEKEDNSGVPEGKERGRFRKPRSKLCRCPRRSQEWIEMVNVAWIWQLEGGGRSPVPDVLLYQEGVRSELRWWDWWENEVETVNSDHPFKRVPSAERKRKGSSVIGHSHVCLFCRVHTLQMCPRLRKWRLSTEEVTQWGSGWSQEPFWMLRILNFIPRAVESHGKFFSWGATICLFKRPFLSVEHPLNTSVLGASDGSSDGKK